VVVCCRLVLDPASCATCLQQLSLVAPPQSDAKSSAASWVRCFADRTPACSPSRGDGDLGGLGGVSALSDALDRCYDLKRRARS